MLRQVRCTVTTGAVPKINAITASVTPIPADPISSNGRRPIRSTNAIATRVVAMFTTEVNTVILNESSSVKPTDSHRTFE